MKLVQNYLRAVFFYFVHGKFYISEKKFTIEGNNEKFVTNWVGRKSCFKIV